MTGILFSIPLSPADDDFTDQPCLIHSSEFDEEFFKSIAPLYKAMEISSVALTENVKENEQEKSFELRSLEAPPLIVTSGFLPFSQFICRIQIGCFGWIRLLYLWALLNLPSKG